MIYLVMDGSCDKNVLYATTNENDARIFMRNFVSKFPSKWDKPEIEVYKDTSLKVMLEKIDKAEDEYEVDNYAATIKEEIV